MSNLVPMVLVGLLVICAMPLWPWSKGWGWAPAGIFGMGLATLVLFQLAVLPEA